MPVPYVYTTFEAIDARRAFPCFDEPAFKIPWSLTLHVPKGSRALANAPEERKRIEPLRLDTKLTGPRGEVREATGLGNTQLKVHLARLVSCTGAKRAGLRAAHHTIVPRDCSASCAVRTLRRSSIFERMPFDRVRRRSHRLTVFKSVRSTSGPVRPSPPTARGEEESEASLLPGRESTPHVENDRPRPIVDLQDGARLRAQARE